jgi:hypothetical protein
MGAMDLVCAFREPTLDELLDDPMTVAVMNSDGIDRQSFADLVRQVASRAARPSLPAAEAPRAD